MLYWALRGLIEGFCFVVGERCAIYALAYVRDRQFQRRWPPYWLLQ